jgi:hypothetical protein
MEFQHYRSRAELTIALARRLLQAALTSCIQLGSGAQMVDMQFRT